MPLRKVRNSTITRLWAISHGRLVFLALTDNQSCRKITMNAKTVKKGRRNNSTIVHKMLWQFRITSNKEREYAKMLANLLEKYDIKTKNCCTGEHDRRRNN